MKLNGVALFCPHPFAKGGWGGNRPDLRVQKQGFSHLPVPPPAVCAEAGLPCLLPSPPAPPCKGCENSRVGGWQSLQNRVYSSVTVGIGFVSILFSFVPAFEVSMPFPFAAIGHPVIAHVPMAFAFWLVKPSSKYNSPSGYA